MESLKDESLNEAPIADLPSTEDPVEYPSPEPDEDIDADVVVDDSDDTPEAEQAKLNGNNSPLKAIKLKCIEDCCCGVRKEAFLCPIKACPLWPFRKGRKPIKGKRAPMSEEHKEKLRQNIQALWDRRRQSNEESQA